MRLTFPGADLPTDSANLAYRAAERVLARVRRRKGLRLHVRKRLPVAAGLGGGSSNAAATIQALAALLDTGWSRTEMAQLGQEVGSDVPFFFYRPTALVEGRGERVTPLQLEAERWLLLVNPGIAISTAWAYERLAAVRAGQVGRMPGRLPRLAVDHGGEGPQLVKWHDMLPLIENDFAPVMEREYPVLCEIRELEPGARQRDLRLPGDRARRRARFHVQRWRDPGADQRECAGEGCLRLPVMLRSGQQAFDGTVAHARCSQAFLGLPDHRRNAVLRLRPPGP